MAKVAKAHSSRLQLVRIQQFAESIQLQQCSLLKVAIAPGTLGGASATSAGGTDGESDLHGYIQQLRCSW